MYRRYTLTIDIGSIPCIWFGILVNNTLPVGCHYPASWSHEILSHTKLWFHLSIHQSFHWKSLRSRQISIKRTFAERYRYRVVSWATFLIVPVCNLKYYMWWQNQKVQHKSSRFRFHKPNAVHWKKLKTHFSVCWEK